MTRTGVGPTRLVLLFLVLSLITVQVEAQSRLDISATGGLGYFNTEIGTHRDQGLALQASLGLAVSETIAIAPQVTYWKDGNSTFLAVVPELRWRPGALRVLQLSGGVGIGSQGVTFLTTGEGYEAAGRQQLGRVVGTLGVGFILLTAGPVQPMLQARMTSVLADLEGNQAIVADGFTYGNATLFTVGVGLRFGGR